MDIYKCPKWENRSENIWKKRVDSDIGLNARKIIHRLLAYFFILFLLGTNLGEHYLLIMETMEIKNPIIYPCEKCNYSTQSLKDFNKHLATRKHKNILDGDKNPTIYPCEICNYSTQYLKDFNKHLSTRKHKNMVNGDKKSQKSSQKSQEHQCSCCNKTYSSNNNLWKHKKKCSPSTTENPPDIATMFIELLKDHKELRNTLIETTKNNAITTTNSHNNSNNSQFNLQVFLNETSKDAMNLTDFINSLQVTMEDFENTGKLGYVEGITRIILNGLKQVDTTKRPIHCTDLKRETVYVKNKDSWEKENLEKEKLKTAVKHVARMNLSQLPKWQKENPASEVLDTMEHNQYMKFAKAALGGMGDMEETRFMDKIMKNVIKEVTVNKE